MEAKSPKPTALVVDDDEVTLEYVAGLVAEENFHVRTASSFQGARASLNEELPDVLLADLSLPDGEGIDLFRELKRRSSLEIVVITGHASVDSVVECLRLGACDYLTKPIDAQRLKAILRNALRIAGLETRVSQLCKNLRHLGKFGTLVGVSPSMARVYDLIEKVAPTDATVLITGESGCGKEVVAQTIHEFSRRHLRPCVAVNCGAISTNLIESELFGHEKGSFTGASTMRRGSFEQADGGALFLDEIAEMPLELQVKLLRALETGVFLRVGGSEEIHVDVRFIAATNRVPHEAIARGRLREDLFYRLNVFSIDVPPLRERREDVDLLTAHFLSEFNRADGTSKRVSEKAMSLLRDHHWPGNVRELKNAVQRAFIIARHEITSKHLPPEFQAESVPEALRFEIGTPIAEMEKRMILSTLDHLNGNKKQTAARLGLNIRTLYNRLKEYQEASTGGEDRGESA